MNSYRLVDPLAGKPGAIPNLWPKILRRVAHPLHHAHRHPPIRRCIATSKIQCNAIDFRCSAGAAWLPIPRLWTHPGSGASSVATHRRLLALTSRGYGPRQTSRKVKRPVTSRLPRYRCKYANPRSPHWTPSGLSTPARMMPYTALGARAASHHITCWCLNVDR